MTRVFQMTSNCKDRVCELTQPQERVLKQVWTYLFHFWQIPVNGEAAFKKSSVSAADTSEKKKKKTSFFGKLQSTYSGGQQDDAEDEDTENKESEYVLNQIHHTLKDLDPATTRDHFWDMLRVETPDTVLLKFVRARKWKIDKTMSMIAHSMIWREESQVDAIINGGEVGFYENGEEGVIKNLELQKAFITGHDKEVRPILLARPRLHYAHDQSEADIEKYCLLIIEQAKLFFKSPVETATILFDLSGFSMSNMDYGPVKFLITCFEAHYPESLGHMFIHKAPWIFSPIWNIVKNWLDPVVSSKINFTKSIKDLTEYIDLDQLPEYLGGENTVDLDSFVKPDGSHDIKLKDVDTKAKIVAEREELVKKFVHATVKWIESETEEESSKFLQEKASLGNELTENYSALDPYVRSRSIYDIDGTLKV